MNSAALKVDQYTHKMDLAETIDAKMSELTLDIANLSGSKQVSQDVDRILALRKEYRESLDYLKESATTDEDRGLLGKIEEVVVPWREFNNRIIQAVQAGKRVDTPKVREESLSRFGALKSAVAEYVKYRQRRLEVFQEEERAASSRIKGWLIAFAVFAVLTAAVLSTFTARDITVPLAEAVSHLDQIADGDLSRDAPAAFQARADEIGMLTNAMQKVIVSVRAMIREISGGVQALASSSTELASSSAQMTTGSRSASDKANSVAAAAEEMSSNVTSVAAGMEQTTTNLANVASATEQMTATIGEIAGNSEKARCITGEATRQAARITEQIQQLGHAAREIGKVTETITEISSQTNLLALNATIEAARAGSAGKGFAVVANEIKALAQQTAAATEDIKTRIGGVQSATAGGISEIEKVSHVIQEVSDIVASIAAAIEEQATTTKDIARNVTEASQGVSDANTRVAESSHVSREIAKDIQFVNHAAADMAGGSAHVNTSAAELATVAEKLKVTAARFHV
jgi:methyl-accepting chemotaxis protein